MDNYKLSYVPSGKTFAAQPCVDIDVIWTTIKQDIPMLEKELKSIK